MSNTALSSTPHLLERHWPLPALLAWALAWAAFALLRVAAVPVPLALGLAALLPAVPALSLGSRWRQGLLIGGFPLSALMLGAGSAVPSWLWLLPLAFLLLLYPVRAWRDAPVFPTAPDALAGLDAVMPLPPDARILDAGSGLGHGLQALHAVWPQAQVEGLEHSAPLAWLSRLRCPWARVRRGDMWAHAWGAYQLVYLFQRPESMARAWHKARAEMAAGSWLASLEFEVPGVEPAAVLRHPGQRPLMIYRLDGSDRPVPAQPGHQPADKTPTTAHVRADG